MTSWFRPWKENSKEVKCITLAQVKRIMQKPSICKIMVDARSRGERFRLPTRHINQYEKKEQGNTTIFVASVYHPVDELKNTDFINILSSIMSSVPKTAKFMGGHDVNGNLGTRSKMYRKTLGPWGIDNSNMKRRILIEFFSHNQLKIANIFFKKTSFVAWIFFSQMRSPFMLDVISVSEHFFKCVRNYWVSKKVMISDHSAVRLDFMNQSIKYKIDCKAIR